MGSNSSKEVSVGASTLTHNPDRSSSSKSRGKFFHFPLFSRSSSAPKADSFSIRSSSLSTQDISGSQESVYIPDAPVGPTAPNGISIEFLHAFVQDHSDIPDFSKLSCDEVFDQAIDLMTRDYRRAYIDFFRDQSDSKGKRYAAPATVYVSSARGNKFSDVVDVMISYSKTHPDAYFWVDILTRNQHMTMENAISWCESLEEVIRSIGVVLVVMTPWLDPLPLHSVWVLYEMALALQQPNQLVAALPPSFEANLLFEVTRDPNALKRTLDAIHVETAHASLDYERLSIMQSIEKSWGAANLVLRIRNFMHAWYSASLARMCAQITQSYTRSIETKSSRASVQNVDESSSTSMSLLPLKDALKEETANPPNSPPFRQSLQLVNEGHDSRPSFQQSMHQINDESDSPTPRQSLQQGNEGSSQRPSLQLQLLQSPRRSIPAMVSILSAMTGLGVTFDPSDLVQATIDEATAAPRSSSAASSFLACAAMLSQQNSLSRALQCCHSALQIAQELEGPNGPLIVNIHCQMGSVLEKQKDLDGALVHFQTAAASAIASSLQLAEINSQIANVYKSKGMFDDAVASYRVAISIFENLDPPLLSSVVRNMGQIAYTFMETRAYDLSLEAFAAAYALSQRVFGENSTASADLRNGMGLLYSSKGDAEHAIVEFQACVDVRKRLLSDTDLSLAASYYHLGKSYSVTGDYEQARESYEKAAGMRRATLGQHTLTASTLHQLALTCDKLNRHEEAMQWFSEAVQMRQTVLGDHVDTAVSLFALGATHYSKGEYEAALSHHQRALDIRIGTLGMEHLLVAASFSAVGSVNQSMGNFARAFECFTNSLDIRRQSLGAHHPETGTSHSCLGSLFLQMGEFQQAIEHFTKTLDIRLQLQGPVHADIATIYDRVGNAYFGLGKYDAALELYVKSRDIRLQLQPSPQNALATSHHNIGLVQLERGLYAAAETELRIAMTLRTRLYGPDHLNTAITSLALASAIYRNHIQAPKRQTKSSQEQSPDQGEQGSDKAGGMAEEEKTTEQVAMNLASQAKDKFQGLLGPSHYRVADALVVMGKVAALTSPTLALPLLDQALAIMSEQRGADHVDTAEVLCEVALQRALLNDASATEICQKGEAVLRQRLGSSHPRTVRSVAISDKVSATLATTLTKRETEA